MTIVISSEVDGVENKTKPLKKITNWICKELNLPIKSLEVILVGDNKIKTLHYEFLNINRVTDVITFNLSDDNNIEGEIYISIDRAGRQAKQYDVSLINEIARLVIHGCLHLAGYNDLHPDEKKVMKQKEDFYVNKAEMLFFG